MFGTEPGPITRMGDMPALAGAPELPESERKAVMHVELPILAGQMGTGRFGIRWMFNAPLGRERDQVSDVSGHLSDTAVQLNLGDSVADRPRHGQRQTRATATATATASMII